LAVRPPLVVVSVEALAPIALLPELLVDVSVLAVLLVDGLLEPDAVLLVDGVLEPEAAVLPVLGLCVVLPVLAPAPEVPGVEPVVAPVVAPPVVPELDEPLPDVCAMDNPPIAKAAAAAKVVRVFLVVDMFTP
jgi:hypothetical protein